MRVTGLLTGYTLGDICVRPSHLKRTDGRKNKSCDDEYGPSRCKLADKVNSENKQMDAQSGRKSENNGDVFFGKTKLKRK